MYIAMYRSRYVNIDMDIDIDTDIDTDIDIDVDIDIDITYTTYILDNIDIECIGSWFSFPVLLSDYPTTNPKPRPALSASPGAGRASIIFVVVASTLVEHLKILLFFNTLIRF